MVWETTWKPFNVEKMIEEMNLLWDSFFAGRLRRANKAIRIVEAKEIEVKKVIVSRATEKR